MPDLFCTALPAAGTTGRALLRLSEPEAVDFLDALVSNSVAGLAPGRAAYAALLTPQSKFLPDFFVTAAGSAAPQLDLAAPPRATLQWTLTPHNMHPTVHITPSHNS